MTVRFNSGNPAITCDKCNRIFRYIKTREKAIAEGGKKHYCPACTKLYDKEKDEEDVREKK